MFIQTSLKAIAPDEWFTVGCPKKNTQFNEDKWNGLPVISPTIPHDFTYISEYEDSQKAAAIFGRLYGPRARQYFLERQQSHFTWRLKIEVSRVKK